MTQTDEKYGTHVPVLERVMALTTGPVLECGAGNYSTPLLHHICEKSNRFLLTVESDADWLNRFSEMKSANHKLMACPRHEKGDCHWADAPYASRPWSVVFVDNHPAGARLYPIAATADSAEFIVVHDTESPFYAFEPLLRGFRFRYDYKNLIPWTTVVSNFRAFTMDREDTEITCFADLAQSKTMDMINRSQQERTPPMFGGDVKIV